jgi:hypothetical protein
MKKILAVWAFSVSLCLWSGCSQPLEETIGSRGAAPAELSLNRDTLSLSVGGTETLIATVGPENAANKDVTWTSSNTTVATVSGDGVVRGLTQGVALITVRTADSGKMAACAVMVPVVIDEGEIGHAPGDPGR